MPLHAKAFLSAIAVFTISACTANGGFGGQSNSPPEPVDCQATPDDPACSAGDADISGWTPVSSGAASATYTFGGGCQLDPLVSCSVSDETASYDGDAGTFAKVSIDGGAVGSVFGPSLIVRFDTGPVGVAEDSVAAVDLSIAPSFELSAFQLSTEFEGAATADEPTNAQAIRFAGTNGETQRALLGFKNTAPYDTIVLSMSLDAGLLAEFDLWDVVTAAAPPEDGE